MTQFWICPQGHRWPVATSAATLQVGVQESCPDCGAKGNLVDEASAPAPTLPPPSGPPSSSRSGLGSTMGNAMDVTLDPAQSRPRPLNHGTVGNGSPHKIDPPATDPGNEATLAPEPRSADDSHTMAYSPPADSANDGTIAGSSSGPGPASAPRRERAGGDGVTVEGYEILGVLGRGGMGVVYKARQIGLNRLTALKMILSGAHASAQDLARFQIEAQAVAKLQHPNIVQIYDVNQREGRPYFSLEYVEGGTLQKKTEGKPLLFREAAKIIEALARAMHYAHQRNIVHRDLKPANVLMAQDGTPKITDFGLAKQLDDDSQQTGSGAIMGTPSYMAPEQARGKTNEVGPTADIYSLGAIFYDLLTGRPPFCGATVLDTLQQVQNEDPVPPRRLLPKIPPDVETICLKCLQKETHKRYPTAQDLAEDLQRFLKNEPIHARPVGLIERGMKWARRRPTVAALLGVLAFVLIGGFTGMFTLWFMAETSRIAAERAEILAKDNAAKAGLAADQAREAEKVAVKANDAAQKSLDYSRRTLYDASMNLAQDAYQGAKITRLRELLEGQDPAQTGGVNLRGFEWSYLRTLFQSEKLALKSHVNLVSVVTFRPPSGRQFASASGDGTIVLWSPEAPADSRYTFLRGHEGAVRAIAFSRDGRWLASGAEDNLALVWDLQTPSAPPRKLAGHKHWVNSVTFNKEGTLLATGSEDRTVRLWDLEKVQEVASFPGPLYGVTGVAFTEDSNRLAAADLDRKVRVWDVTTREEVFGPLEHRHWVSCLAFSPNARGPKYLVSGGWEDRVRVWSATDGRPEFNLEGLTSPVTHLAFSPDGQRLACSCQDNSVVIWDMATQRVLRNLPAEKNRVRSVAFSPDGQLLASVDFDTLTQEINSKHANSSLLALSFGGDKLLGASAQGTVLLWNVAKDEPAHELLGHAGPVRALAFSKNRQEWASGGEDGQVFLWNHDGEKKTSFRGHDRWILSLAHHPLDNALASASADHSVIVWNLETKAQTAVFKGHTGPVLSVAYSPDGTQLASGSSDRTLRTWKVVDGKAVEIFKGTHDGPVTRVVFSPNGKLLASAGWDRVIKIWDREQGTLLQTLRGHTHGISSLAFTSDSSRLGSGSEDRTVKLWDLSTGQETLTLKGPTQGVTDLAFSADDSRLACTSWDNSVTFWATRK